MIARTIFWNFLYGIRIGNDSYIVRNDAHIKRIFNMAWTKMVKHRIDFACLQFILTTNTLYAKCHPDDFNPKDLDLYTTDFTQRFHPKKASTYVPDPNSTIFFSFLTTAINQQTAILQQLTTNQTDLQRQVTNRSSNHREDNTSYHASNFCADNLPEDVKEQFDFAQNPHHVMTKTRMKAYIYTTIVPNEDKLEDDEEAVRKRCYWANLNNIITITGKHGNFTYHDNEKLKTFIITFPKCAGTNIHQRHLWYITCSNHCFNFGIYLPEWSTLRPTTHPRGFNIGKNEEDANIPKKYRSHINRWSESIFSGILYSNKTFQIPDRDGYVYIHNLIKRDYPSFMHMPHLLIMDRPKQSPDESLTNFLYRTKHWINMRGLIENSEIGIDSETEIDSLISKTLHGKWLHSWILHDRQNPNHTYKYEPGQLVGTLEQWLQEPPKTTKKPYINPYYNKYTNLIETDSIANNTNSDTTDPDNSPILTDFPVNDTIILATMDFIKKNPASIKSPVCIFCKVINPDDCNHTFEECKLCKSDDFCRRLAIDAVSFSNKILNRQKAVFATIPDDQQDKTIQALKSFIANSTKKTDFQEGNILDLALRLIARLLLTKLILFPPISMHHFLILTTIHLLHHHHHPHPYHQHPHVIHIYMISIPPLDPQWNYPLSRKLANEFSVNFADVVASPRKSTLQTLLSFQITS